MILKKFQKNIYPRLQNNLNIRSTINMTNKYFSNYNKDNENNLNENEENIKHNNEIKAEKVVDISSEHGSRLNDMYKIQSNKMGQPNIKNIIDTSKFIHNNVKVGTFNDKKFNKDHFENRPLIPVSPRLGPFEVKSLYL
jgi:hypothetical protein